jgi:hypothetical protein
MNKEMDNMNFFGLIVLAAVVEGIVGYSKLFFKDRKFQWQIVAAIILGIVLSLIYGIDFFETVGLHTEIPYVGRVLTGLLVARGSNYISELIKLIGEYRMQLKEKRLHSERQINNNVD